MIHRARSKRKRACAGSVYIEALAVITLFTLLFTIVFNYGRNYTGQLLAGEAQRAASWAKPATCADWDALHDALDPSAPHDLASRVRTALALRRVVADSSSQGPKAALELTQPLCGYNGSADHARTLEKHWLDELLHEAGR